MGCKDARDSQGEPRLLISRAALIHNTRVLRQAIPASTQLCAMVKADAYGHGAGIVVDTLSHFSPDDSPRPAVDQFAVATIDEALALPPTDVPIMVMRPIENAFVGRQRELIEHAISRGWTLSIRSTSAADDLARIAMSIRKRAAVHVMVDTGMHRCGTDISELPALLEKIDSHASLRLTTLGTHFANSEIPHDEYTRDQLAQFLAATDEYVQARQSSRPLRHAANSGAIFFTKQAHLDVVRPGISIYGIDPTLAPNVNRKLRPVMKWTAPLIAIADVPAGDTVGYNRTFTAERDTRIGLIPVGYADGYMRWLSNRASVMIHGIECPVVGRVSMDMLTVSLHLVPNAVVGDEAILIDDDPLSPISAYRIAKLAGTTPYELFTRIGPRIRRVAVEPTDAQIQAQSQS